MVFFHQDNVGHKVIVIYLDLEFLSHLVESMPNRVFTIHHHSHQKAHILLHIDPVSDEGFVPSFILTLFPQDPH